jgi:trimeric autotransporter adhesin
MKNRIKNNEISRGGQPESSMMKLIFLACVILVEMLLSFESKAQLPTVTSLSTYIAAPGTALTITGTNFNTTATNNIVFFGAVRATVTSATSTSLSVTVPFGATYAGVSVTNTASALTGYDRYPFMPTFDNSAYVADIINLADTQNFAASNNTFASAAADLDGDGLTDMIGAVNANAVFGAYLNKSTPGNLSFDTAIEFGTISNLNLLAISDLDGDGKQDVISASNSGTSLSVHRNTSTVGSISFAAKINYSLGSGSPHPYDLAIADLDGDGKPEIISIIQNYDSLIIFRNTSSAGSISFAAAVSFATGATPYGLTVGDIDGDGKPDVAVVNRADETVSVFRNLSTSGTISLDSSIDFVTGTSPYDVTFGDLDGDGKLDMIVDNNNASAGSLSIYRNLSTVGSISFDAKIEYGAKNAGTVVLADLDGDQRPDMVTTLLINHTVKVYMNTSSPGALSFNSNTYDARFPRNLCIGDMDGDGKSDVITATQGLASLSILRNDPLSPISGDASVCIGSTTTLSDITADGTWASSNTSVATVGATTGIVTGVATGTATITYKVTGGRTTITVSVNALPDTSFTATPNPTLPNLPVSVSATDGSVTGYAWAFGDGATSTLAGTTHAYTSAGTYTVSFTATSSGGCTATATTIVTVNAVLANISGNPIFCIGDEPDTLTHEISGGTWSSSSPSTASVDVTTGVVTGLAPGYAIISYNIGSGYLATVNALVGSLPPDITGYDETCVGYTTGLFGIIGGSGTWSSSDAAVATIGTGSGVVTGITPGTATMTYTNSFGCYTTRVQTINETPGAISGTTTLCAATTTTLSCTPSGGTWLSSNSGVATAATSTGIITGVTGGTATISYILASGCSSSVALSTTSQPSAITGTLTLCSGGTTTLSSITTGGTWASSDVSVATIDASSGLVTAIGTGTATITYTGSTGCTRTTVFTVSSAPAANTGNTPICVGGTTTLSNSTSGGTWSSSNTAVVTAGSSTGLITGISSGTANITYSISGTGCRAISEVTIDASPAAIDGSSSVCIGDTTMLTHPVSGGTWSSSLASRATIDATTGQVIAVSVGLVTMTYHLSTTCYSTFGMVIKALPAAISGTLSVCEGSTTALSCTPIGGAWTSGSSTTAYINASTGVATGVLAGTTTITYSNGCLSTAVLTVNSVPAAITGTTNACAGGSTTLSCATGGGTWSSSNTAVATVGSSTGVVSGISAGTTMLSYIIPGGCSATAVVTIGNPPAAITGTLALCVGGSTTLSAATSGGTWSSSNTAVITTGTAAATSTTITAIGTGTANISYTVGGCASTATVTVSTGPAANSGTTSICVGATSTLSNATSGGTWSSSAPAWASVGSTSGIVTGLSAGVADISYITGTGCFAVTAVTVLSTPASISGGTTACIGLTTNLSHTVSGGTWTSSMTGIATIDASTGVLTGVSAGSTTVTYMVSPGCYTTTAITVYGPPSTIGGTTVVCEGKTTTLTNSTYGGTWTSSNTGIATIGATSGIATGVSSGVATITYRSTSTSCYNTTDITVNALPATITGNSTVCVGSLDTLSSTPSGGTWTTSSSAVATVGSATGIVSGNAGGAATISYTLSTGCSRTFGLTVANLPGTISGTLGLCISNTTTLSSATAGQTWSSSNTAIATAGSVTSTTGLVTGTGTGTATISYTNASGCSRTTVVTVNAALAANTGGSLVCVGHTVTLSNATTGGTWQSSTTAKATVGYYTGVVTGVAAGTSNITYKVSSGCVSITQLTVEAAPASITGTTSVCIGQSIRLTHETSGGTWSTSSTTATVDSDGEVTGVSAGYAYITYSLSSGCSTTITIIVRALPHAISGSATVATGSYTLLTDATSGGVWSSGNVAIASMPYSSLGYVFGVSTGSATITYTAPSTGCFVTHTISVYSTSARLGGSTEIGIQPLAFSVFPNPTSGALSITAEVDGEFTLFTLDGKLVHQYQVTIGNNNVSLPNDLAAGIYMCRFNGNDGSTKMVRLVVEK